MLPDSFYINNHMTVPLESFLKRCKTYEEFENQFSDELLSEDGRIGQYLDHLLFQHDKKASVVSFDAHIINFKKNNPSRDALISIAFALGASEEELQYLLKYAGHAPLYVRRKRDVIIWFGIMKGESLETVNDNLLARGLKPLYKE